MLRLTIVCCLVLALTGCGHLLGVGSAGGPPGTHVVGDSSLRWIQAAEVHETGSVTEASRRLAVQVGEQRWQGNWVRRGAASSITWYFARVGDGTQWSYSRPEQGRFSVGVFLPAGTSHVLMDAREAEWSATLWDAR